MMRLWVNSYAKSAAALVLASAVLSTVVHTGVIAAWIYATLPDPGMPSNSVANRVYFIPPPDRSPGQRAHREVIHYVDLNRPGVGSGDGPRTVGEMRPALADETIGPARKESVADVPPPPTIGTEDSVFSILEVDTAVVRSANSAAPVYPLSLLMAHIMGSVAARYIVDTTGFADTASFTVMRSTNPEFVTAVREALPYMRFKPAKIGPLKVRQLVEQQFSFKINDTTVAALPHKQKP
jgi:protein TonB